MARNTKFVLQLSLSYQLVFMFFNLRNLLILIFYNIEQRCAWIKMKANNILERLKSHFYVHVPIKFL